MWRELRGIKTKLEGHISNCIVAGVENPSLDVGVYACDDNAYFQYRRLFQPIIKDLHGYDMDAGEIMKHNLDISNLEWDKLDKAKQCIKYVQLSGSRNLEGYSFMPTLDSISKAEIESKVNKIIDDMDVKVEINKMTAVDKKRLMDEGLLFERHPSIEAIIPNAKCSEESFVYYKNDLSQVVWINADDHVKYFVNQKEDTDLRMACELLFNQLKNLEANAAVCQDQGLGYLTCNPSYLGTALRMKVIVKLEKSTDDQVKMDTLKGLCEMHGIDVVHSEDNTYDFTLIKPFQAGKTEADIINGLLLCINEVLKVEEEAIIAQEAAEPMVDAVPQEQNSSEIVGEDNKENDAEEVKKEEISNEELNVDEPPKDEVKQNEELNEEVKKDEELEEVKKDEEGDQIFTPEIMAEYADKASSSGLTIEKIKEISAANPNDTVRIFVEGSDSFGTFNKLYANALRIASNELFDLDTFNFELTEPILNPIEFPAVPEVAVAKVMKVSRNLDKIKFPKALADI